MSGFDAISRVVTGPDGSVRWGRVNEVLAGTEPAHRDLRLALVLSAGLVALASGASLAALSEPVVTVVALVAFTVAGFTAGRVMIRLRDHGEEATDIALEELRARYARGDIDLDELQRRIERVHEDGPGVAFADEDDAPGEPATDADPMEILQRRFARGKLSEAQYRSRVAALAETGVDVDEVADEPEPAGE